MGGLNHNLACGSAKDCPPKKYTGPLGETVENGVCVGSSLEPNTAIPPLAGYTGGDGLRGTANSFIINKNFKDKPIINGVSPFAATLDFFAYADNDQMPITRVAVDWGDGSPAYEVRGWFKNKKPWCEVEEWRVCGKDLNLPCSSSADCGGGLCDIAPLSADRRLHFGNSSSACEQNFFTFKHVYMCQNGGVGWDASTKSCKFKPKVQVLDNWGWCNGTCRDVAGGGKGCWDDSTLDAKEQECSNDNQKTKDKHWTSFSGTIEIKPY